MNFRTRATPATLTFQIAPMVDILLVLLVFFIVTWNFALSENDLDVKLPSASNSSPIKAYVGQIVVNVKGDGSVVLSGKTIADQELADKLNDLSKLFPDQAVILRGDENLKYNDLMRVMNICRGANIWNVAFATAHQEPK
ncbi:MAG: biopolymer transporter ExbD [Chthoniobacteraceae bacterium]